MNKLHREAYIEEITRWWTLRFPNDEYYYYIITLMFKNIRGTRDRIVSVMEIETNDFYRKLITRLNRKPNSASRKRFNPQFIICPDLPVPKSFKPSYAPQSTANSGIHLHGISAIPKISRLSSDISLHISANQELYAPRCGLIQSIDFAKIEKTPEVAIRYVFKNYIMGNFDLECFLLLPKCKSEMPV